MHNDYSEAVIGILRSKAPSMLIHIWIEEKGSGREVTTVVAG